MLPSRPFVFAAGLILAGGAGLAAEEPQAGPLEPGRPIERELKAEETHRYHLSLVAGQCLSMELDRRGIQLAVDVTDSRGRGVIRVVGPLDSYGIDRIFVIAKETGPYRVAVSAYHPVTPSGFYVIRIVSTRQANSVDRFRFAALKALSEGVELLREPKAKSRDRALKKYDEAIALWRKAGDSAGEALSLYASGEGHRERGEYAPALQRFEESLALARVEGDRHLEGKTLHRIGNIRTFAGKAAEALEPLGASLSIARTLGVRDLEAESLTTLSWASWSLGRYQQALDYAKESLAVCRAAKQRWEEAWAWWAQGFAYWALGEPERSLRCHTESLRLWQELHETARQATSLVNIGLVYTQIGAYQRALETYRKALEIIRAVGNRGAEGFALHDIGYVQFVMGEQASAQASLEESLRVCREIHDGFTEPYALYSLGLVYETRGLRERASGSFEQALRQTDALGNRDLQASVLAAMARLEAARGNLVQARERVEAAIRISESIRGSIAQEGLKATYLSLKQDAYKTYVDVLLALHSRDPEKGYDAMAFAATERGRARSLLDALAESRLDLAEDLPQDLRTREKELANQLIALQHEAHQAALDRARAEQRLGDAEEKWESLLVEIRRRSPRYASLRYPSPLSLKQVQGRLDPGTAMVLFSVSEERVLAFVVTRDALHIERLQIAPTLLSERVGNCIGLMAREASDSFPGLAERLYSDLVRPWREKLPGQIRRLIIVPDGVLHSLPFEALRQPGKLPRYLFEDFCISYAPSATVLARLEEPNTAGPPGLARVLVVADPTVPEALFRGVSVGDEAFDVPPLKYAGAEAGEVIRFGGPGSEMDLGSRASERRLKQGSLEQFQVIHFATHGFLSERFPSRSSLLLAAEGRDEGLLTAREIYRLKLRSDLVVLSACRTARGRVLPGEGTQGLAQAFFHSGARTIVASLWDVNDRRTAELMGAFYRHLAAGEGKAEALRGAKLDLVRREPGLAPRFWAPFVLIGEPAGTVPLQAPSWWRRLFS